MRLAPILLIATLTACGGGTTPEESASAGSGPSTPPPRGWENPHRLRDKVAGMMSPEQYLHALEATGMKAHLESELLPSGPGWTLRGPVGEVNGFNGRVSSIKIFGEVGDYNLYVGACSGGIWKCHFTNMPPTAPLEWVSIGDGLPNPAAHAFDIDPNDENHILAGTGEVGRYPGAGMYVTYNGGDTWSEVLLPECTDLAFAPKYFHEVAFAPQNSTHVLAATDSGLFQSTDGGVTWDCRSPLNWVDVLWHPSDPTRAYAVSENWNNGDLDAVMRSTDGGWSWSFVFTASSPWPGMDFINARLAICRDQPSTIVLVLAKATAAGDEWIISDVLRTDNAWTQSSANVSWTNITNPSSGPSNDPVDIGGQAHHALAVAIKPDDPDHIIVGAQGIASTTNGGISWDAHVISNNLNFHHADHTCFYFFEQEPSLDHIVWVGNDGGVYYDAITIPGPPVNLLGGPNTGLAISQIDYLDADPGVLAAGLQDNGVLKRLGSSPWSQVRGGDGTEVTIVDPASGDLWYCTGVNPQDLDNDGEPDRPWRIRRESGTPPAPLYDTQNPDPGTWGLRMYKDVWSDTIYTYAKTSVYSMPEGNTPGWFVAVWNPSGSSLLSIGQISGVWGSQINGKTLFVSYKTALDLSNPPGWESPCRNLSVCRQNSAGSWVVNHLIEMTGKSTSRIMSVTPSYRWSEECWVAAGCGSPPTSGGDWPSSGCDDAGVYHVLPNGTVEDITGNLSTLNIVHSVAVTPFNSDILYAATDIGVFRTTDGGENWAPFQDGLPINQCTELKWVEAAPGSASHELVVSTYGRGVYTRTINMPPVIYVNTFNITGPYLGTLEAPYQTVQDGVNAAPASGAIIAIRGWEYLEPQTIDKVIRLETYGSSPVPGSDVGNSAVIR